VAAVRGQYSGLHGAEVLPSHCWRLRANNRLYGFIRRDISGQPLRERSDVRNGNAYHIWYQVWANYTNGDQSSWSVSIPLQQPTVQAAITPGASGLSTVVALGVPTSAALVRLEFIDENAVSHNDTTFDYNGNTPVSSIINGQYPLPTSWIPPTNDAYGSASYALFAQTIDASGNPSAPTPVTTNWTVTPFQDGRVQMKQT